MKGKRKTKKRLIGLLLIIFIMLLLSSPWTIRFLERTILAGDQQLFLLREVAIPYSGNWKFSRAPMGVYVVRNAEIRYFHQSGQNDWTLGTESLAHVSAQKRDRITILENSPRYLLSINEEGYMLYQQAFNRSVEWMVSDPEHYLLMGHQEEDQLMPFTVLDHQGRVMGNMLLPKAHVVAGSIHSSRNRVVLGMLETSSQGYKSVLLMHDLKGVLESSWSFPQQLIFDIQYENQHLSILFDDKLQIMTEEREILEEQSIDPFYLKKYNGNGWVLIHRRDQLEPDQELEEEIWGTISFLSVDGKERREAEIGMEVLGMDANQQYILLYNARQLKLYNHRLELIAEHHISRDIEKGFVLDHDTVALQTRGEILFYEMR